MRLKKKRKKEQHDVNKKERIKVRKGRKFLRTTYCFKRSEETIKRYKFTNRQSRYT